MARIAQLDVTRFLDKRNGDRNPSVTNWVKTLPTSTLTDGRFIFSGERPTIFPMQLNVFVQELMRSYDISQSSVSNITVSVFPPVSSIDEQRNNIVPSSSPGTMDRIVVCLGSCESILMYHNQIKETDMFEHIKENNSIRIKMSASTEMSLNFNDGIFARKFAPRKDHRNNCTCMVCRPERKNLRERVVIIIDISPTPELYTQFTEHMQGVISNNPKLQARTAQARAMADQASTNI